MHRIFYFPKFCWILGLGGGGVDVGVRVIFLDFAYVVTNVYCISVCYKHLLLKTVLLHHLLHYVLVMFTWFSALQYCTCIHPITAVLIFDGIHIHPSAYNLSCHRSSPCNEFDSWQLAKFYAFCGTRNFVMWRCDRYMYWLVECTCPCTPLS